MCALEFFPLLDFSHDLVLIAVAILMKCHVIGGLGMGLWLNALDNDTVIVVLGFPTDTMCAYMQN